MSGTSATHVNGVFSVIGEGRDIYGTSDEFNFVYEIASGDQTITASIDSLDIVDYPLDVWARGGLMIRDALSSDSKNATVFVTPGHGVGFTWRDATGGNTQYIPGPAISAPVGLRLTRAGNSFSAYYGYGNSWTLIGSATIAMGNTVYTGPVACSHGGAAVMAQFSQVSVDAASIVGVPAPWQNTDVGAAGILGSAMASGNVFTVKGSGGDIWMDDDQFHFVYQPWSGNGELVARLTGLEDTNPWAKAGIMFRQYLGSSAANAFIMLTRDHGSGFQARTDIFGQTSYIEGPVISPTWLRLRREGDLFSGFVSADGVNWTFVGSENIPMWSPMLVGLAVTSHNNAALQTTVFDNVRFTSLP
jgi:regulation of enolase protein 1 (concanavalin A-like superfamily)